MGAMLADLLKDPEKLHNIEVGNVYRVSLGKNDGLTVCESKEFKIKYFIVVGIDRTNGIIYGGLLISSKPPYTASFEMLDYQYLIKSKINPFLNKDSWINCTRIFPAAKEKLTYSNFIGCLDNESTYYIIAAILDENNPVITNKERKKYNIVLPDDSNIGF